jgi:flagellar biosynthesis/type III secretory pathway protein FliH
LNDPNPCALILAAFRRAMRADTAEFMLASRMELVRLALDRGYTEEQVENLIRLLEWVMVLPEVLEERYEQFLEEVKREQNTPYLSVLERKALREGWEQGVQKGLQEGHEKGLQEGRAQGLQEGRAQGLQEGRAQGLQEGRAQGLQEGRAQGLQEGILTLLRTLYGAVPAELEAQLRAIRDVATLNALYPLAVSAGSLENFAQQLAQQQGD